MYVLPEWGVAWVLKFQPRLSKLLRLGAAVEPAGTYVITTWQAIIVEGICTLS
jgi:hypothetical protein